MCSDASRIDQLATGLNGKNDNNNKKNNNLLEMPGKVLNNTKAKAFYF